MKQALILIDIQNTYFEKKGLLLHEPEKAAKNAARILRQFRSEGKPIIFVKHRWQQREVKAGEVDLRAIHPIVEPQQDEIIIEKSYPSAFLKTSLKEHLDQMEIEELVVVGDMTHMCVDTTVRAAMDYGYHVILVEDACTTLDLRYHEEVLPAMMVHKVFVAAIQGTFADVMTTEEYMNR